ncbi:hypothetical protein DFH06DRAFT_1475327 [Mycena polygramma]|nr:hypothetical protein DFH06DRAFT_1475327 [Mycena polygramma]
MARATRSSLHQDKSPQKPLDSKKRKRISDTADEPAQKLQRTDAPPYVATKPIAEEHAAQILHILQIIDDQGLLDRVYPLEQSSSSATTYSLRNLLSNSQEHSLATLRTAVQNLLPISIHPRAPVAAPAAQQKRFCDLALSLLDQASFHPATLDVESLLPQDPPDDDSGAKFVVSSNKRYALMQHLPGGDYWTSADLPLTSAPETGPADLRDLPTGHADLVAIFPTPSTSASAVPKLGDYARPPIHDPPRAKNVPAQRRVTCGSFLDYGPWASFAPSWVQNGREIGMRQMGEVYAQRAQRYRQRLEGRQRALELEQAAIAADKVTEAVVDETMEPPPPPEPAEPDVDALQDILAPAEIESLKAVLGSLELENAVQELLIRNRKALQRLGQLQVERLRAARGGTSTVKEGDEEWDVAHGILESLTLLASLRPRSSAHPAAPLVPPPTVLHTLQQTLPRTATPTWYGTLPPAPAPRTALRDDTTVKVRPGVPAVPPAPAPVPAPIPVTPAQGYGGPYATYYAAQAQAQAQSQRAAPTAGGQYRYNSRPQPQPVYQQQPPGQYYHPQHATTNQVPYGYTGATGYYGAYGAATPTAGGAATPAQQQIHIPTQAQTQGGTRTPTYGALLGGASGASTPVPVGKAVANTVVGKAAGGQQQGQWAYTAGNTGASTQMAPVPLPAHLRAAAAGGGGSYSPS